MNSSLKKKIRKEKRNKVDLVDWNIANNFGDYIEVNKALLEDKWLFNSILEHEFAHNSEDTGFTFYDFFLDLKDMFAFRKGWRMFKLNLKHPKMFTQMLPVTFSRGRIFVDYNLSIILLAVIAVSVVIFKSVVI